MGGIILELSMIIVTEFPNKIESMIEEIIILLPLWILAISPKKMYDRFEMVNLWLVKITTEHK